VIEHVPVAASVTVFPETVHTEGVFEVKLAGSPEPAVAPIVNGAVPSALFASAPKVIVCAVNVPPGTVTMLGPPIAIGAIVFGVTLSSYPLAPVIVTEYVCPPVAPAGIVNPTVPSATVPVIPGLSDDHTALTWLNALPVLTSGPSPVASVNVTLPVDSAGAAPFGVTATPNVRLSILSVPSARFIEQETAVPAPAWLVQLMPIGSARAIPARHSKASAQSIVTRQHQLTSSVSSPAQPKWGRRFRLPAHSPYCRIAGTVVRVP
jgi:hypothetical protein